MPFGNGYGYPYGSLVGDYGLLGGYPYLNGGVSAEYSDQSSPPPNAFFAPPPIGMTPQPAEPPPPVQAVVHEYAVPQGIGSNEASAETITIALKDGTRRSTVATWVQGGKLHYMDPDGKQQVLSADLIDRHETERLNREKQLEIQLPPG